MKDFFSYDSMNFFAMWAIVGVSLFLVFAVICLLINGIPSFSLSRGFYAP